MIPPQQIIVASATPAAVAEFWESMTETAPDVFNAAFVMARENGRDD